MIKDSGSYICDIVASDRDKKSPKVYSAENDMDLYMYCSPAVHFNVFFKIEHITFY